MSGQWGKGNWITWEHSSHVKKKWLLLTQVVRAQAGFVKRLFCYWLLDSGLKHLGAVTLLQRGHPQGLSCCWDGHFLSLLLSPGEPGERCPSSNGSCPRYPHPPLSAQMCAGRVPGRGRKLYEPWLGCKKRKEQIQQELTFSKNKARKGASPAPLSPTDSECGLFPWTALCLSFLICQGGC